MANHKSAKKAHVNSLKNAVKNKSVKSRVKTFIKKVDNLVNSKDHTNAMLAMREMESEVMSAVSKGVLKLNTASRKVSRMNKKVKAVLAEQQPSA